MYYLGICRKVKICIITNKENNANNLQSTILNIYVYIYKCIVIKRLQNSLIITLIYNLLIFKIITDMILRYNLYRHTVSARYMIFKYAHYNINDTY